MTDFSRNLSELRQRRKVLLKRIRESLPAEADALESIDMALFALETKPIEGPYFSIKRGVDAAVACLSRAGKPLTRKQLCTEVVEGGWLQGDPEAYWKLWDVIAYQFDRAKNPTLVEKRGDKVWFVKPKEKE